MATQRHTKREAARARQLARQILREIGNDPEALAIVRDLIALLADRGARSN